MIGYRYRSRWGYDFVQADSLRDVLNYYIPNDWWERGDVEDYESRAEWEALPEYYDGSGNELDIRGDIDGEGVCVWDGSYESYGCVDISEWDDYDVGQFLADWNFGHCLDADDIAYLVETDPLRLRDVGECYDGDKEDEETEDCSALLQDDRFLREIYEKIALDGYEDDRFSYFDKYAKKTYEIEW